MDIRREDETKRTLHDSSLLLEKQTNIIFARLQIKQELENNQYVVSISIGFITVRWDSDEDEGEQVGFDWVIGGACISIHWLRNQRVPRFQRAAVSLNRSLLDKAKEL